MHAGLCGRQEEQAPRSTPSLAFDLTITCLLAPLLAGRSVVLAPRGAGHRGAWRLLRMRTDFSLVKLTPAHLECCSHLLRRRGGRRTRASSSAARPDAPKCLAFWRAHAPDTRLINEYGPTETVVGCCVYEVPTTAPRRGPSRSAGRSPTRGSMFWTPHLQPVPLGVPGELYIGGAGLARATSTARS